MCLLHKYCIYLCVSRKILYKLVTFKVGVQLTHKLSGSTSRLAQEHTQTIIFMEHMYVHALMQVDVLPEKAMQKVKQTC